MQALLSLAGQPLHECNKPMYRMMSRIKVRCPYHEGGASGGAARLGAARAGGSEAAPSSSGSMLCYDILYHTIL